MPEQHRHQRIRCDDRGCTDAHFRCFPTQSLRKYLQKLHLGTSLSHTWFHLQGPVSTKNRTTLHRILVPFLNFNVISRNPVFKITHWFHVQSSVTKNWRDETDGIHSQKWPRSKQPTFAVKNFRRLLSGRETGGSTTQRAPIDIVKIISALWSENDFFLFRQRRTKV